MPADLILQNAVVHTVDAVRRTADAVAVEGGRIVAVGTASRAVAARTSICAGSRPTAGLIPTANGSSAAAGR